MKIVDGKPYINQVKNLIIEYTKKLGRDLTFQNIDDELEDLARKYTEPEGELLVAIDIRGNVGGMIAYCYSHSGLWKQGLDCLWNEYMVAGC